MDSVRLTNGLYSGCDVLNIILNKYAYTLKGRLRKTRLCNFLHIFASLDKYYFPTKLTERAF